MDQRPDNVADDGFEAVVQLDEGFARVAETNEEEGRLGGQVVREPHVQTQRVFVALRPDCRPRPRS